MRVRPGTGAGPPLVPANGIGAPLDVLDPFVDALDEAVEVVRFDVPGVGGSPPPPVPLPYPVPARMLGGLLDELGHGRVDMLGHLLERRPRAAVRVPVPAATSTS